MVRVRRGRAQALRQIARRLQTYAPLPAHPAFPGAPPDKIRIMDIERINAIGKSIADLSERTAALRGYL